MVIALDPLANPAFGAANTLRVATFDSPAWPWQS